MTAYYNEIDPKAAAWLRELIRRDLIAPGDVDERSIVDVRADDLRAYTQCHFFAGIGVWSYALRRAGWPDDRPVWTGSCPCQPFSAAGKGGGFDDERHLWPSWHWLVEQCGPPVIFGEQVASKDAEPWLDLVQADLEALAYSVGAVPFPSAGIGAPHIRDRLYWVADDAESGRITRRRLAVASDGRRALRFEPERLRDAGRMADDDEGLEGRRQPGRERTTERPAGAGGVAGRVADRAGDRRGEECSDTGRQPVGDRSEGLAAGLGAGSSDSRAGPVNGLWRDADWLFCRDGKWRPVEPGTFPLAHGTPARVGRLRGYGNAINAEAAVAWIESYLEAREETFAA